MPLFSMGRDMPDGNMTLTGDGYLDVDWDKRKSTPFFEELRRTAREVTEASTRSSWTILPGT